MSLKDDAKAKSAAKITASDVSTGGDGHDLLTRARALENTLKDHSRYEAFLTKHCDFVEKFLGIAERKVAALDEYGDENWDGLPEEIHRCLTKIAKREPSLDVSKISRKSGLPQVLVQQLNGYNDPCARYLAASLSSRFRAYHEGRKVRLCTAEDVRLLRGVDFETYLARKLREAGFEGVAGTPATGDQGADLIAKKAGRTIAIQAKGCEGSVGNGAVQEIVGAMGFYFADEGWVITNSTFTQSARVLAKVNGITLIDGSELEKFLSTKSPVQANVG